MAGKLHRSPIPNYKSTVVLGLRLAIRHSFRHCVGGFWIREKHQIWEHSSWICEQVHLHQPVLLSPRLLQGRGNTSSNFELVRVIQPKCSPSSSFWSSICNILIFFLFFGVTNGMDWRRRRWISVTFGSRDLAGRHSTKKQLHWTAAGPSDAPTLTSTASK